ncbi:MAG TPA: hypothetical protein VFL04_05325 [Rectinemataceae bacterium]|nr:hypothetical protein [Rectinemataceae bacterium]
MGLGPLGLGEDGRYLRAELGSIEAELQGTKLGELSLGSLKPYRDRLALAAAKDAYVAGLARESFIAPGSGQFRLGEGGSGAAWLTAHLAAVTGGALAFYYLLPSDLRFNHLDYLDASLTDITRAWNSHSVSDYLPAAGAALGGMVLDMALRYLSAKSALEGGREAVDAGKVKLEPLVFPGLLGLGLSY